MYQFAMLQVPSAVVSILAFLVSVGLLILVHEWGHYFMAKRGGVPVEEFSLGMGPVVARLGQRGETTFNLRALPIGGFVRMSGMELDDDAEGGYNSKPMWTRAKIISAGVIVNLIFGFLLMVVLGVTAGLPKEDESKVSVGQVAAGSAAEKAGLRQRDRILMADGKPVVNPVALTTLIRGRAGTAIPMVVERAGQQVRVIAIPKAEKDGVKTIGRLGFIVSNDYVWQRRSLVESITVGADRSWSLATGIVRMVFSKMMFTKGQVGGPIAIAQQAGDHAEKGLPYFVLFVAMLSINLGVLNLLPIPVLDGGHMLLLLVESVRRKKLPAKTALVVQGLGLALLLSFFFYATVSDVLRTIHKG